VSISHTQWYPIWLSYCGALLEKLGHRVKLIDAPSEGLSHEEAFTRAVDFAPNILVVYSSTKSKENDIFFAGKLKDRLNNYVVFVGPYVSAEPDTYINKFNNIDAIVKGEFDYPISELANEVERGKIKNLVWKKEGVCITNDAAEPLTREKLDEIPFVTEFYNRHLNVKNYRVPSELYPFVDIFTGRGCFWGRCTFCLWPQSLAKGPVYNTRSIDNVTDELKFVKKRMSYVKEVFFQDDTLPQWRIVELCEAFLSNKLELVWSCYVRADLDSQTLRLMKESGCLALHVGYETVNNSVLKSIRKGLTSERMTEFTKDAKKAGLHIHGDFLIGLPGETESSIKKTIAWARKLNPETAQFLPISLYPGTELYESLAREGWIKDGEPDYSDLPREKLHRLSRRGYREFYLNRNSVKKIITHPYFYFFSRKKSIYKFIVSFFKS